MAEQNDTGDVKNSVPSSPVVKNVSFLDRTPIPSVKATQWVQGAPTPIRKGQLTPMSEALKLLVGFFHWRGHNGGREHETPPYYF